MVSHKITKEFAANRAKFEHRFASAYGFLMRLEAEGPRHGLWLSSATNAHLYKDDAFLAYLRLKSPAMAPPSLLLSPNFNNRIVHGTIDRSEELFPTAVDLMLKEERGLSAGWALRRTKGATELRFDTPASFFDRLFRAVATLDTSKSG